MPDRSPTAFMPITAALVLFLGTIIAWGMVYFGGMAGVIAWTILIQLTMPVLGILMFSAMMFYVFKYHRDWQYVGLAISLSIASAYPGLWMFGYGTRAFPADPASVQPPAHIRPPADGELLVYWGGNTIEHNYHTAYPDQRWAYDLAVKPVATKSKKLEDYGCYGVPVLAPIQGKVWSVENDMKDHTPGRLSNEREKPFGNHVVLKLSGGTYLVIAHLKKGSVVVSEGDVVNEGQQLAACGNSGNTSEPHIHIHHQRQDPKTNPIGFAEGLPLYFRDVKGQPMPRGGVRVDGDVLTPTGETLVYAP